MKKIILVPALIALTMSGAVIAGETPSNPGTAQYIVNIKDGDTVSSPVKVVFGLSGMGVAPAGVDKAGTGHHHILLDRAPIGEAEDGKEEFDFNIAADEHNIHYGKGQTEITLDLKPGKHTLQLVLGDKDHIPHDPPIFSDVLTVTVK